MTIDTRCQICHAPMQIEYEPNDYLTAEGAAAMATCDPCLLRRFNRKDLTGRQNTIPAQASLPYKDL